MSGGQPRAVDAFRCEPVFSNSIHSADSAGDLNGDGTPDLMLGQICAGQLGQVVFVDGKTGAELFTLDSPDPVGFFGHTVHLLPDMTGDGKEDWLIHERERGQPGSTFGRVYIFDSQTREVVRTIRNTDQFNMEYVEVIPDVDRDGKPELLIGTWYAPVHRDGRLTNAGRAIVRSLETGEVLYELMDPEPKAEAGFGVVVSSVGDVTGDGIADVAIGAPWKDPGQISTFDNLIFILRICSLKVAPPKKRTFSRSAASGTARCLA